MTTPQTKNRSLMSDERGAAMVEAAIMLPVFIIIFASVMYMSRKYETGIRMQERARHCAWLRSKSACEADAPSGCTISEDDDMSNSQFSDVTSSNNVDTSDIDSANSDAGFGGDLMDMILGDAVMARQESSITLAGVLGGGTQAIKGELLLSCNEKTKDNLGAVIESAWNSLAGDI